MLTVKKIIKYKLWIASTTAILIALVVIPALLCFIDVPQASHLNHEYYKSDKITVPKGIDFKNADSVVYDFLMDVKRTDGIIILGTSETANWMSGKNYYSLLNQDSVLNRDFYAISGAGRCANMYIPLILKFPKAFEGLDMIFYINPTYWRKDLNKFDNEYFERYVDFNLVLEIKSEAKKRDIYDPFIKLSPIFYANAYSNKLVGDYRRLFQENLNHFLNPNQKPDKDLKIASKTRNNSSQKINIDNYYTPQELENERNKINLEYNVSDLYLADNDPFPRVDTRVTYQDDLLQAFISLCQEFKINCVFYLGPYNEIYCTKMNPEHIPDYRQTVQNIKSILEKNNAKYIDGTSISTITGTFSDKQHISEYGAYLTALQIKEYYEKNN